MQSLFVIALGGALGAVCRFVLSGWVARATAPSSFPYGTLAVNVAGSFLLGLVMGLLVAGKLPFGEVTRQLVAIGFLGALTTFSTFSYETVDALRLGRYAVALTNVGASVVLTVLATTLGLTLAMR